MASVSFQIARTGLAEGGNSSVLEGTAAPTTANDIEVRIDLAAGWTKLEIDQALQRINRFLIDPNNSTTITI